MNITRISIGSHRSTSNKTARRQVSFERGARLTTSGTLPKWGQVSHPSTLLHVVFCGSFRKACGARDRVKPGVKRSGTPG